VFLLPAGFPGMGLLNPEGYTALSPFPHPLVVPQLMNIGGQRTKCIRSAVVGAEG